MEQLAVKQYYTCIKWVLYVDIFQKRGTCLITWLQENMHLSAEDQNSSTRTDPNSNMPRNPAMCQRRQLTRLLVSKHGCTQCRFNKYYYNFHLWKSIWLISPKKVGQIWSTKMSFLFFLSCHYEINTLGFWLLIRIIKKEKTLGSNNFNWSFVFTWHFLD